MFDPCAFQTPMIWINRSSVGMSCDLLIFFFRTCWKISLFCIYVCVCMFQLRQLLFLYCCRFSSVLKVMHIGAIYIPMPNIDSSIKANNYLKINKKKEANRQQMIAYEIETISWRMLSTESFNSFWIVTSIFCVCSNGEKISTSFYLYRPFSCKMGTFFLLFFTSLWLHWSKIMCVILLSLFFFSLFFTVAIEISNE